MHKFATVLLQLGTYTKLQSTLFTLKAVLCVIGKQHKQQQEHLNLSIMNMMAMNIGPNNPKVINEMYRGARVP